ncbi:RecQ family ATP-dependent DNA helicase [Ramlibacter albus]|uniref:RecQ family ATP-dependent DNA helicase n=1 Tax=Ramlibacter albus TaxID=2079448 RepID=UPI00338FFB21
MLRGTFGLRRLRPGQRAVIERVLRGEPTLAVMPTGSGKSLCYQLPALLMPGLTLVVSPLIALMKDQCESLRELGVEAVQLNSALGSAELQEAEAAIADGRAKIAMTTPERLQDAGFRELLHGREVSLVAVDEAHCISQWGHDFRPAFLEIAPQLAQLGRPVVLALTATAQEDVARDICSQLGIPPEGVVNTSAHRANLDLRVESMAGDADKLRRAVQLVRKLEGSGIVYCATIKAATAVHEALHAADEPAGIYHGKLPVAERSAQQEAFMEGRCRVMVATNAFGLGIDKADIRFVLHYQLPPTLESYYQEAGRAGRDGEPARCTLLFLRGDKAVQQFFMAGRYPTGEDADAIVAALREPAPDGDSWTLALLQGRLARPRNKLQVALGLLRKHGVVEADADGAIRLLKHKLKAEEVDALMDSYGKRRDLDREGLERMVFYAQTGQCRWRVLLEHLDGEAPFERCEHCDNCRRIAAHEKVVEHLAQESDDEEVAGESTVQLSRGDIVMVKRYGRGIVEQSTALEVTVAFADGTRRAFLPQYVAKYRARRGKAASTQADGRALPGRVLPALERSEG